MPPDPEKILFRRRKSAEELQPEPEAPAPELAVRCRKCHAELADGDDLARRICAACLSPAPRADRRARPRDFSFLHLLASLFMIEGVLLAPAGLTLIGMALSGRDPVAFAGMGIGALLAAVMHLGLSQACDLLLELERRTRDQ